MVPSTINPEAVRMKPSRFAHVIASAVALGTPLVQAQTATASDPIDIKLWDASSLRGGHSAERLLDTEVRGENDKQLGEVEDFLVDKEGRITGVVVESQGFMDIGDTHFFVPWKQVKMGPNLSYVQVPVNERNLPDFSLFNNDESITGPGTVARGEALLGEFVRLKGGVPYGYVDDVIFSSDGRIQSILVSPDRRYGYGVYAYPFAYGAYRPGLGYYDMPYGRDDISALKPFDYSALGIAADRRANAKTTK